MSTSIEQRIVEMKFDNAAFAKGVDSTIQDLDRLDKATQFEGGKNGIKQLQVAADQVNLNQVMSEISNIQASLDHMQSFGFQVFRNLSNQAINWATSMVKSLSVDQISDGFSKYELKMDSIKTIMNASGESLDVVKDKLQELNNYSDKTIYSFSDMTSNIGKFTNAGVSLDKSVIAIKGISNAAALAGAGANEASRAMYNFSQALASGSVKLIDWKSIENANMATVDFKQQLIETAVRLGTVVEKEGKYLAASDAAAGKTEKAFTATLGFNDALQTQWMTSDVLVETLSRYADETDDLGKKAYAAAQEVTTYHKMLSVLREAVSTKWTRTFEILFGDLNEATKLWTGMSNAIGGIVNGISDTRNGILEMWKAGGGHTYLMAGLKNIYNMFKNITEYIGLALETLFGHRLWGNFEKVQKFFDGREGFAGNLVIIQRISAILGNISKGFWHITNVISRNFNPKLKDGQKRLAQIYLATQAFLVPLRGVFTIVTGIASKAIPVIAKAVGIVLSVVLKAISLIGAFFTVGGFQGKIYAFANMVVKIVGGALTVISKILDAVWSILSKTFLSLNLDGLFNGVSSISGAFSGLFDTIRTIGVDAYNTICNLIDSFAKLFNYNTIEDMFKDIGNTISGFFSGSVESASGAIEGLSGAFEALSAFIEPIVTNLGAGFNDWINGINDFWQNSKLAQKLSEDFSNLGDSIGLIFSKDTKFAKKSPAEKLSELIKEGYTVEEASKKIHNMSGEFKDLGGFIDYVVGKFDDFKTALSGVGIFDNIKKIFGDIGNWFKQTNIGRMLSGTFGPIIEAFKTTFKDFNLKGTFIEMGRAFGEFIQNIKDAFANAPDIPTFFNKIKEAAGGFYEKISTIAGPKIQEFIGLIDNLKKALNPKEALPDGSEEEVSQSVIGIIKGFLSGLVKGIITFDWGKVMSLLTIVLGVKFLKVVYDFLNGISLAAKGFTGFGKTVKKFTNNISGLIGAAKWQIMADSIFRVATAIVMLAGAIFVLSFIPEDNLKNAITALGAVTMFAAILMIVYGLMKKMSSTGEVADKATKVSESIKEAISKFVDGVKESVSKFLKLAGIAAIIVAVAVGVGLIAKVLLGFIDVPWQQILKGLFWTALIAAMLAGVTVGLMYAAKKFDPQGTAKLIPMAILIYLFAKSMQDVAKVVSLLGATDDGILWKGMAAMGLLAVGIAGLIIALSKYAGANSVSAISAGLLLFAVALMVLVVPITAFALLPWQNLLQAFIAIAGLVATLFALVAITKFMKTANVGLKELGVTLLSFIGVAVALFIFAQAIRVLTDQGEQIKKYAGMLILLGVGIAIFAGVLGGIGYFLGEGLLMLGGGMLFLGLGLLAAAAAVWVFAQACVLFANGMDTIVASVSGREDEVVNAISTIIFAAIKGIIDGIGYALAAIVVGLDDAVILLRQYLPMALLNLGLLILECIGAIIWAVFEAIGEAIVWIGEKINEAFPGFWAKIHAGWAKGWREFCAVLLMSLAKMFERLPIIGDDVSKSMNNLAMNLLEDAQTKSAEILDAANVEIEKKTESEVVPTMKNSAQKAVDAYEGPFENSSNKVTGFMDQTKAQFEAGAPEVAAASEEAGDAIVDGFDKTEELQQTSYDMNAIVQQYGLETQGLVDSQSIDFSHPYDSWGDAASIGGEDQLAEVQAYLEQSGIEISSQDYSDDALASMKTYSQGVADSKTEADEAAEEVSKSAAESLKKGDAKGSGKTQTQEFASGMRSNKSKATSAANDVSVSSTNEAYKVATSQDVQNVGLHFDQGLANGMSNNASIVNEAARVVMVNAMNTAKNAAVIQSPSKKMEEVGYYWDAGLAIGIFKNGKMIFETITDTMKTAISKVKQSMAEMGAAIEDSDIDFDPVITPVVDSDEAIRKLRRLNDILSGGTTTTIRAAARNDAFNRQTGPIGTNNVTNNSNVSYVQNITSPRALRSRDIYRQTKNLIAVQKGARA